MKKISLLSLSFFLLLSNCIAFAHVIEVTGKSQFESQVLKAGKPAVVKVYATWCGPCKNSTQPFHELSAEFPGVTFAAMDIDKHRSIASKYGASSLPTFLFFDSNGNKTSSDEGFTSKDNLRNEISNRVGASKKKPELEASVTGQATATAAAQANDAETAPIKGSSCLAGQSYFENAYNAVRDFFANIGTTIQSWFK